MIRPVLCCIDQKAFNIVIFVENLIDPLFLIKLLNKELSDGLNVLCAQKCNAHSSHLFLNSSRIKTMPPPGWRANGASIIDQKFLGCLVNEVYSGMVNKDREAASMTKIVFKVARIELSLAERFRMCCRS